jgi:hypothetical protein
VASSPLPVVDFDYLVSEANPTDLENVLELYKQLYESNKDFQGADIRYGEKTRAWVTSLFQQALDGKGTCLLATLSNYPIGVTLAVEAEFPYDTTDKKTAIGYGTFVRQGFRKNKVAYTLYTCLKKVLKEQGYESYIGAFLTDNHPIQSVLERVNLQPFQVGVRWDL